MESSIIQKEDLTSIVKSWVVNDNQIRALNKKLRELRQEKKKHNESMIRVMKQYEIDNFDVKDGQIHFKQENRRETLTQSKLLEILAKHPQLEQQQANLLSQFVYDNRKVITKDVITRKVVKVNNDDDNK